MNPRRPSGLLLVGLGAVQSTLLILFLLLPLPTLSGPTSPLRRLYLLFGLIPGAIPDTPFRETLLGQTLAHLQSVGNLPQRIPLLLAALLIAGAASGVGRAFLRLLRVDSPFDRLTSLAFHYGLGVVLVSSLTLILGRLGLLDPWFTRGWLAALWLLHLVPGRRDAEARGAGRPSSSQGSTKVLPLWLFVLLGPLLALMALGALQPTIEYDSLEYHLQGPKEYFLNGRITFLAHNVYTSMPLGVEMLHLLGMIVFGSWYEGALVGQFLVMLFAPATALLIAWTAGRLGSATAGAMAAVLYLFTPWIYRLATFPLVEGPLCFFHAACIALVCSGAIGLRKPGTADQGPSPRWWLILGTLSGGAMACKYPGLVTVVLPFGVLAAFSSFRARAAAPLLAFGIGLTLSVGPWLIRNVLDTGNPVYPLAYSIFGGEYWDDQLDAKWRAAHGPRSFSWSALGIGLADVAGRSDWQSPLLVLFAPLALFRPGSRRGAVVLASYIGYLFATWFFLTHRLDRFWLPVLPPLVVLAALGGDFVVPQRRAWTVWASLLIGAGSLANFALIVTPLSGPTDWTADLNDLRRNACSAANAPLGELERRLPEGSRTLVVGQAGVFHFRRPILYNTVFNREWLELLASGRDIRGVREELWSRGITHIYVDWSEIERHRKPGGYGYSPFVTPERFREWVDEGVLGAPLNLSPRHQLYPVLPPSRPTSSS